MSTNFFLFVKYSLPYKTLLFIFLHFYMYKYIFSTHLIVINMPISSFLDNHCFPSKLYLRIYSS